MEVVFLGTGNAFASGGRHHMAILLRDESAGAGTGVLVDCGPSALVALKQQRIDPDSVGVILLSHLHGDHFGGIPMLAVDGRYRGRRTSPIAVFGPRGTRRVLEASLELFYPSMDEPPLAIEEVEAGESRRLGSLTFTAFEVDHFSTGPAFGYRITLGGKRIVFSGDTAWTDSLGREAEGADLFICECSSFDEPAGKHVAHSDLLRNREHLGAKRIVLVHPGDDVIARESELAFDLASDGRRIRL